MSRVIIIHDEPDASESLAIFIEDDDGNVVDMHSAVVPGGEVEIELEAGHSVRVAHWE